MRTTWLEFLKRILRRGLNMATDKNMFFLKIYRGSPGNQYWEEFELPVQSSLNITSALMEIQKNPVNRQGKRVEPVVWEQGCLEEVCGSCSMLIDGKPRQACTALIEQLLRKSGAHSVTLAPFTKFPLVRDLIVDRTSMFDNLKRVHGWIDVDNSYDQGFGPKQSEQLQQMRYNLSCCMTCGCCVEACPQSNKRSAFVGPQAIAQAELFNLHPTGKMQKRIRLRALMEEGGVSDCGNAQNCVRVCPKNIALTDAIAAIGREVTVEGLKMLFNSFEQE